MLPTINSRMLASVFRGNLESFAARQDTLLLFKARHSRALPEEKLVNKMLKN